MHEMGFRSVPSWLLWIVGGALYGVALRLLFGALPSSMEGVMSAGFLLGTPIAIGALTLYGARHAKPSVWAMLYLPWITVGLMLLGCAVAMLEGAICLAMMAPIFFACASIGGVVMGLVLRVVQARQSTLTSIAALPLVMLFAEGSQPLPDRYLEVRQSIHIDAAPEVVWEQLLTARDIQADELPFSVAHLIGVPRPVEGVNLRAKSATRAGSAA
jgi:hypothetical protein